MAQVRVLPGGEVLRSGMSVADAASSRDALAKGIYTRLFDWAVESVNAATDPDGRPPSRIIGVLDIFGFEDQWRNGFEQLFINATNEALQHVFNDTIFKAEVG
jgi:myosin heavy subunit